MQKSVAYKKYISLFLGFYRNIMVFTKHYPEESDFTEEHRLLWRKGYGGLWEALQGI